MSHPERDRMWRRFLACLPVLVLGSLLALGLPGKAAAHGGGTPQLANTRAGPYWMSVWTQPDPIRAGKAHFTVAVARPPADPSAAAEPGPPVLDAVVEVQLAPVGRPRSVLVVPATHQTAANKLWYEADVDLPSAGRWLATVAVHGPDGSGSAGFEIEVLPPARFPAWTLFGGAGLAVLAAGWAVLKIPVKKRHA